MNTKIKLAGGDYFDKKDSLWIWSGEIPLITAGEGMKIMVTKGDEELLLSVTGVCIELSGKDSWQVVYVKPASKQTEKLLTESPRGVSQ